MLFVVRLVDRPGSLTVRQRSLPAHLEWLDQHQEQVRVAGSLRPQPDAAPVGACWIVEATDKIAVEKLIHSDPFWVCGLRQEFEILHWSKAFPERFTPV